MTKPVHMTVGVSTFLLLSLKCPSGFEVMNTNVIPTVAMLSAAVGSYLPDLDMKPMHYSQGKKGIAKAGAKMTTKGVNALTGGHRGITHTLLFPAIMLFLYAYTTQGLPRGLATTLGSVIFGCFGGWVLHIFADLFNGKGCPLFWPLMKSKIHIMDVPSEGIGQWIWCAVYVGLLGFIVLGRSF